MSGIYGVWPDGLGTYSSYYQTWPTKHIIGSFLDTSPFMVSASYSSGQYHFRSYDYNFETYRTYMGYSEDYGKTYADSYGATYAAIYYEHVYSNVRAIYWV